MKDENKVNFVPFPGYKVSKSANKTIIFLFFIISLIILLILSAILNYNVLN